MPSVHSLRKTSPPDVHAPAGGTALRLLLMVRTALHPCSPVRERNPALLKVPSSLVEGRSSQESLGARKGRHLVLGREALLLTGRMNAAWPPEHSRCRGASEPAWHPHSQARRLTCLEEEEPRGRCALPRSARSAPGWVYVRRVVILPDVSASFIYLKTLKQMSASRRTGFTLLIVLFVVWNQVLPGNGLKSTSKVASYLGCTEQLECEISFAKRRVKAKMNP